MKVIKNNNKETVSSTKGREVLERLITIISLFAGCGGSSYGYHLAGFLELLAIEIDKHARKIFGWH